MKMKKRKEESSKFGDVIIDHTSHHSRHQWWKLDRQKRSVSSGVAREIFTKIDELEEQCTYGSFTYEVIRGADSAKSNVDKNCKNITQADSSLNVPLNALSNDFSSTFMLDEELELEQETDQPSTWFDDEDDEIMVNDQAVEKLVIITQELKSNRSSSRDNKPITGSRDEKPRCFAGDAYVMNLRTVDCSTGGSSN
ncbi:hypothetical protein OROHE_001332 [Orobanche hederae]